MNNLHVLFVDDHADTRFVFSRLLVVLGHTASLAASSIEAIKVADHEQLDLAIIDLGLPAIEDGLALLQSLTDRGIRSVVCSGYGQTEDINAATSRGCLALIVKPTTIDAVVAGINRALAAEWAFPPLRDSPPGTQLRAAA